MSIQNHRIKTACATGAFTLAMAMPALADSDNPVTRQLLSEADRIAIFGRDSNFQVALLTEAEMAETKGAAWWGVFFRNVWYVRLGWGGFYGSVRSAWDMREDEQWHSASGITRLFSDYIILYSTASLISKNPALATASGLGVWAIERNGGVTATVRGMQRSIRENEWSIGDVISRVSGAIDTTAQDNLQGSSRSSVSAYVNSGSDSNFLARITNSLDRASLQNFLSSIPERYVNPWLAEVTPEITREDFLENLPPKIVNEILFKLPEDLMQRFTTDVLSEPMRAMLSGISTGATVPQTETMRVHWLH